MPGQAIASGVAAPAASAGVPPGSSRVGQTASPSFWEKVRVPRFRSDQPRLLLFTSGYFLEQEIIRAASRLGWGLAELPLPTGGRGSTAFVESLLSAAAFFRPDFVLTVNHLGLDSQGELLNLFDRMALPLASWFVDSPRLILHDYPGQTSPWCALFTWDQDTVPSLTAKGFEQVHFLPLATDTTLFTPGVPGKASWRAGASFVGDSMVRPVDRLRKRLKRFPDALAQAGAAATEFAASPVREALDFLREDHPELLALWEALPDPAARLDLEQFVTFEATRLFRLARVRALLPFSPIVAGDPGWRTLLPRHGWKLHPPLDYYRELPGFYPASQVNLNATSLQMKGAVNQRVFDVPACGAFLLTDWREQMAGLFEPATETATYRDPGEIPGIVRHYLDHPAERERIAAAARRRVLADHDYTDRLKAMLKALRKRYA